jgi:hypothetical protein
MEWPDRAWIAVGAPARPGPSLDFMLRRPSRSAIFPRLLAAIYGIVVGIAVDFHGLPARGGEDRAGVAIGCPTHHDRAVHDDTCPVCLYRAQAQSHHLAAVPALCVPEMRGRIRVFSDWPIPTERVAPQSRGPPVVVGRV